MTVLPAPVEIHVPGLYDMDDEPYFADPVPGGSLSQSRAKTLLREGGPAKFAHEVEQGEVRTAAFDFGKVVHATLLGSGAAFTVLPGDDLRIREVRQAKDEAEACGLIPIKPTDWARVQAMVAAVDAHPLARVLLGLPGHREVAAFAVDEPTGIWLRGKLDLLTADLVVDYKTSADAGPAAFRRSALTYGYATQDAMYRRLSRENGGPDRMVFVVQDKEPPHLVAVVELDDDYRAIGEANLRRAIDLYARCRETGLWPGYGDELITLSPPAWALREFEAELADAQITDLTNLIERHAS